MLRSARLFACLLACAPVACGDDDPPDVPDDALPGVELGCFDLSACRDGALTTLTDVCLRALAEVPGAVPFYRVCVVDDAGALSVTWLAGNVLITNPGYTFSAYGPGVVASTLDAEGSAACQRAFLELDRVRGGLCGGR